MKKIIGFLLICILFSPIGLIFRASGAGTPVDMIRVPSGYAMMGAENGDLLAASNAKPNHLVYLEDRKSTR